MAAPAAVVDAEGRLYEYDPIGNRINSAGGTDPQVTYARNAVNQYTALTGGVNASPSYDDDGNMTGYDGAAYTWNAENRLIAAETADKKITFLYDYMGRRVRKQVYSGTPGSWNASPDETRVFVYDGWNLIKETVTGDSTDDTYYVWGPDLSQSMQGAGGIGGLVCRVSGTAVRHYTYDANGNVGQLVDEAGAIVAHYEYDPFGNEIRAEGDDAQNNPFRSSTKYLDAETGLYYYGFRYYHTELGRWISRDPMGEQGGYNLYGFVSNNPVFLYDAWGLWPKPPSQWDWITFAGGIAQMVGGGVAFGVPGGFALGGPLITQGFFNILHATGITENNKIKVTMEKISLLTLGQKESGTIFFYYSEIATGIISFGSGAKDCLSVIFKAARRKETVLKTIDLAPDFARMRIPSDPATKSVRLMDGIPSFTMETVTEIYKSKEFVSGSAQVFTGLQAGHDIFQIGWAGYSFNEEAGVGTGLYENINEMIQVNKMPKIDVGPTIPPQSVSSNQTGQNDFDPPLVTETMVMNGRIVVGE
ncbi:RHS repeat domain-containing protein [Desulfonema ishimotonii]|uniref:RHS repeat domain-containing protein n=1 Tax=Desulfonema ishimotonii TaxID=45657 RepID=UPI000F57BD29|nr:RHS repeat-associated core domain-containing protein [Desulfonema ishimotonii]